MFAQVAVVSGLAALLAIGLVPTAVAHADNADDTFINALAAQGITGERDTLIAAGHAACDGYGSAAIVGLTYQLMGQGLSSGQASNVILDGWRTNCPEKVGGLPLP